MEHLVTRIESYVASVIQNHFSGVTQHQHQPQPHLNSALCVRSSAEAFVCSYPLFYSKMRSNTGSSALTSSFSQYTRVHNSWILLSCSYHDNLPALSQPQPVSIFSLRETPRHSSRICSL